MLIEFLVYKLWSIGSRYFQFLLLLRYIRSSLLREFATHFYFTHSDKFRNIFNVCVKTRSQIEYRSVIYSRPINFHLMYEGLKYTLSKLPLPPNSWQQYYYGRPSHELRMDHEQLEWHSISFSFMILERWKIVTHSSIEKYESPKICTHKKEISMNFKNVCFAYCRKIYHEYEISSCRSWMKKFYLLYIHIKYICWKQKNMFPKNLKHYLKWSASLVTILLLRYYFLAIYQNFSRCTSIISLTISMLKRKCHVNEISELGIPRIVKWNVSSQFTYIDTLAMDMSYTYVRPLWIPLFISASKQLLVKSITFINTMSLFVVCDSYDRRWLFIPRACSYASAKVFWDKYFWCHAKLSMETWLQAKLSARSNLSYKKEHINL